MPPEYSRFHEEAPHSRLFILASKALNEDDFKKVFEPHGKIEDIFLVKDRATGENKGIVYIKFSKTSEAAKALEALHGEQLGGRPMKVRIASRPEDGNREVDLEEISTRLFVVVPKAMTDDELFAAFKEFGNIDYARTIKDYHTKESKGIAYVKFRKFSDAANAFENCEKSYKAVFAKPKKKLEGNDSYQDYGPSKDNYHQRMPNKRSYPKSFNEPMAPDMYRQEGPNRLLVIADPILSQDQIWSLFDIVPSMDYCDVRYNEDRAHADVVYKDPQWAAHAKQKFHGFEYPPGHRLIVRFADEINRGRDDLVNDNRKEDILKLAETLLEATSQLKKGRGNVDVSKILQPLLGEGSSGGPPFSDDRRGMSSLDQFGLPERKPLEEKAVMESRCFIYCHPKPLTQGVLRDMFCRFGGLIDVYLIKGKSCGYAMYANQASANKAIKTLNGFEYHGVTLKVVEAEDKPSHKKIRMDFY